MTIMVVTVDGVQAAAVDLAQVDMLAVHVNGDLTRPGLANLSCHGGTYPPDGGESTFRIWAEQDLDGPAGTVTVTMLEQPWAGTPTQGKTVAELFPDEPPCERTDFTPTAAEREELRSRPRLRDAFSWSLHAPDGARLQGRNGPDDDSFAFAVLWTADRPALARVYGSTTNIDNVLAHRHGSRLYEGSLAIGESVTFGCGE
ncbi:hypothetical protein E7V67_019490 [[Empedobacter] haloabium]|uniref:Uncharacterized protein n=1 Tax=[Empedobacter] haloabium TaxID=592317 RepID=A0ABZ1UI75_9BURK